MSKIKIVIFGGFGASGFPKHIAKQIKEKEFPQNRCGSIIDILEKYPSLEEVKELKAKYEKLKVDEVLRAGNRFYFGAKPYNISCTIEEVDTSRPWTFGEYDGAEGIEYLDFKCVSKELNYWKKK